MEPAAVTDWLRLLSHEDNDAATRLWQRYTVALERLTKSRIGNARTAVPLEPGLAQSVLLALWHGTEAFHGDGAGERDGLWWVLLEITRRKVIRLHAQRSAQRDAQVDGRVSTWETPTDGESTLALPGLADLRELSPEATGILKAEHNRLMLQLRDDELRTVAALKLEGYSHTEIALISRRIVRTVIRKLQLIREQWSSELIP